MAVGYFGPVQIRRNSYLLVIVFTLDNLSAQYISTITIYQHNIDVAV